MVGKGLVLETSAFPIASITASGRRSGSGHHMHCVSDRVYLLRLRYSDLNDGDDGYCIVALGFYDRQNAINFQRNHAHKDGQKSTEGK